MTYSSKIRNVVLKQLQEGKSIRAVAKEHQISTRTVQNWKKDPTIKRTRNKKPTKIDDALLRKDVEMYPDAYQHERAVRFNCSARAIGIALKRLGITQKKDSQPSKSQRRGS